MSQIYYENGEIVKVLEAPQMIYSDGGRSLYFKADHVGDCVTRAICNATDRDYKEVYDALKELAKKERITKRHKTKSSVRDGVNIKTCHKYIEGILGWEWHPTMQIGSGCTTHLCAEELPKGTLIVQVSGHLTCVKNGVIYDTYDCSRDGTRCVYGYWMKPVVRDEPTMMDCLERLYCTSYDPSITRRQAYEMLKSYLEATA